MTYRGGTQLGGELSIIDKDGYKFPSLNELKKRIKIVDFLKKNYNLLELQNLLKDGYISLIFLKKRLENINDFNLTKKGWEHFKDYNIPKKDIKKKQKTKKE